MKRLKTIRAVFLVLFLAAVISAAVITFIDLPKIQKFQASIDQRTAINKQLQAEIREIKLKERGYKESMKAMPDSMVLAESKIWNAQQKKYTAEKVGLQRQEIENTRLMRKDQRARAEVSDRYKRRLTLVGISALIFLAGLVISARMLAIRA